MIIADYFQADVKRMTFDCESVSCRSGRSFSYLPLEQIFECPGSRIYRNSLLTSQLMSLLTYTTPRCLELLTKHCPTTKRRRKRGLLTPWFDADYRA
jgi:hypothetical protein